MYIGNPGNASRLCRRFVNLSYEILNDFVFVTAVSSNHFNEMTVGLYHVRAIFGPNKTVVVYDIGLVDNQRKQVNVTSFLYVHNNLTIIWYPRIKHGAHYKARFD